VGEDGELPEGVTSSSFIAQLPSLRLEERTYSQTLQPQFTQHQVIQVKPSFMQVPLNMQLLEQIFGPNSKIEVNQRIETFEMVTGTCFKVFLLKVVRL